MERNLEIAWRKLVALMEQETPEDPLESVEDIIVLAQRVLDKHPELGFKILIDPKTKTYKVTARN